VENVFNRHPQVRRSALIEVAGGPALAIEPASWPLTPQARQTLAAELRAIGEGDPVTAGVRRFYFHQSFPVDARHNAKIFRDRLGAWAATQTAIEFPEAAGAVTA